MGSPCRRGEPVLWVPVIFGVVLAAGLARLELPIFRSTYATSDGSSSQPTSSTPHSPIRIASAASCRREVGCAAPDQAMLAGGVPPARDRCPGKEWRHGMWDQSDSE